MDKKFLLIKRAAIANGATVLGVIMGALGIWISIFPPHSAWWQILSAVAFFVLFVATLFAVLIPEYQKIKTTAPENVGQRALDLGVAIGQLSMQTILKSSTIRPIEEYEREKTRLEKQFHEQYVSQFGAQLHKFLDDLRANDILLKQPDDFYLRVRDPSMVMGIVLEFMQAAKRLGGYGDEPS
jgi:hypothetical protein